MQWDSSHFQCLWILWSVLIICIFSNSKLEDSSHGIQDRQRVPGSLPLQGFRRTDYSSSPPTRGDSSSYSRGNYGRWESRSSGWSDRDNDAQSDRDSGSAQILPYIYCFMRVRSLFIILVCFRIAAVVVLYALSKKKKKKERKRRVIIRGSPYNYQVQ